MAQHSAAGKGLRRSLNVWQAVGLSVALMAPSMAANINPQATASTVGRAVPLAFFLAAIGVLLVAYGFVRMCQYFQHAGSVYAFVGATLGPRAGVVAGIGLLGTYLFYGVVTSAAMGIFGTAFLQDIGIWPNAPWWAPFPLAVLSLAFSWLLTVVPARRGTGVLLNVEFFSVVLITLVCAVVLIRLLVGDAPQGQEFDLSVFVVPQGTELSAVFLGVVFGFLSFAGFEAAASLGEEARNPRRDIPRAILGVALFGGTYYVVVTAIEMMGFGTDAAGVLAFGSSPSLLGDLGTNYIGSWVGVLITLGATVSAFGSNMACTVSGSRLLYALARDVAGNTGIGRVSATGTPANAATATTVIMAAMTLVCATVFDAQPMDTFLWPSTVGTLILLVAYVLTTIGAIRLVFVQRRMPVPRWQVAIPIGALALLGYTIYRNVIPYPTEGPAQWFPIVAGAWLLGAVVLVVAAPALTERIGSNLAAAEGFLFGDPDAAQPAGRHSARSTYETDTYTDPYGMPRYVPDEAEPPKPWNRTNRG